MDNTFRHHSSQVRLLFVKGVLVVKSLKTETSSDKRNYIVELYIIGLMFFVPRTASSGPFQ